VLKTGLISLIGLLFIGAIVFFAYRSEDLVPAATICTLGECPLEITQDNSGERLSYTVTTRFGVSLDPQANPPERLRCTPEGVIGAISNVPPSGSSLYIARFEAVQPGTCTLTDDNFSAVISVQ
jgi:hypothetical protein